MKEVETTIRMMTYHEAHQRILFNRGRVLDYEGRSYYLNAGLSDKVYVFTRSICIYVLTVNSLLGYIGLDAYMPKEPDPINTVFLHSVDQLAECLGRRWQQLSPKTITERLVDYLI